LGGPILEGFDKGGAAPERADALSGEEDEAAAGGFVQLRGRRDAPRVADEADGAGRVGGLKTVAANVAEGAHAVEEALIFIQSFAPDNHGGSVLNKKGDVEPALLEGFETEGKAAEIRGGFRGGLLVENQFVG
jgi:hypothetical protein